jgi:uncharacterized repeat protein (TIGR01451 family)
MLTRLVGSCVLTSVLASPLLAEAQYTPRFTTITNGAVTLTGNSLGLDGAVGENGQGTRGSIGTFTSTDAALEDVAPPPTTVLPFPPGTTPDWTQNSAAARLVLPAGARVLHAELLWGGTWAYGAENVRAVLDTSVTFTTPSGTFAVAGDPATAITTGSASMTSGVCIPGPSCFYVRSADVTALVQQGGTYTLGGVPATQGTSEANTNYAGWTLAVVYEDFRQPVRNLALFLGLEPSDGATASLSGFCTPPTGTVFGRLAVTAAEGDARVTGDDMRFGPTADLTTAFRLSGPRNPATNFFSGQITDDRGELATAGTFGDRNHTPGSPVVGARQGWDITNVDISGKLANNQTTAFARGTTSGDGFRIMAMALQIDAGGPGFHTSAGGSLTVDRASATIGDVLTYTVRIDNSTGTANADNVVLVDTPAPGTTLVPGSVTVNGAPRPGADLLAGVPLGSLAIGQVLTVTFQAQVTGIPSGPTPHLRANQARWTFDFVTCAGQPARDGAAVSNVVVEVPTADLAVAKTLVTAPPIAGAVVRYRIVASNAGPNAVTGAIVSEPGPTPALGNVTWTCTPGAASTCPPSGVGPLSAAAAISPGDSVTFTISGILPASTPAGTTLSNTATIAAPAGVPDFNLSNNAATSSTATTARADLRLSKTGPATQSRNANVGYTLTVTNDGPSHAQNVLVADPAPAGLTLVGLTGACAAAPGCTLAAGASETVTASFFVPPDYTGPDPVQNAATVSSATPDPAPANNAGRASTALDAAVANVSITNTNGTSSAVAGLDSTYTITVSNSGPASALQTRIADVFDPAFFTNARWTCAAAGTSSCTVASGTGNIDTLIDVDPGAGQTVVFTVQVQVVPGAEGPIANSATATTAPTISDPDHANNTSTDTDAVTELVDLSISATGPATVVPGTTVDYTLSVTNSGPSLGRLVRATHVMIDEALVERPELAVSLQPVGGGSGIVCETATIPGPITQRPLTLRRCTFPELAPGESRQLVARVTFPPDFAASVDPTLPAPIFSRAFLTAIAQPDADTDDHVASFTSQLTPRADIGISKIGPASIVAGSVASYFIRVSNAGPTTATNVVVEDPIPAGLVFQSADGPCAAAFPCTIPILAPGDAQTTRIDLFVPRDYAGPATFVNTASVRSSAGDPGAADNTASVSTLVVAEQADLQVEKTGSTIVTPGRLIEYVARVTNLGPGPAIAVTSSDVVPGGTSFVDGTAPGDPTVCPVLPSGTTNLVYCLTPFLPVGGRLDFRFTVQADTLLLPGSVITTAARASSPTPDLHSMNDRVEVVTRVAAPNEAELLVEKIDAPDPVVAGADVTYTITVRSLGPAVATNVTLTDTLPAGFTLVSASPSQGSCTGAVCSLGTMAPSTSATVTIVATSTTPGLFINVATVSATEPDPVPANNTNSQSTTAADADQADLAVTMIGPAVLGPGDASVYTIRVTNRGPAPAIQVDVASLLPPGLSFVANTGDCVTAFPCEIERLAPGQSAIFQTTFIVEPSLPAPAVVTNTAIVSAQTIDPDPANNRAAVVATIHRADSADLIVLKRDSPDPVVGGARMSYTLSVANRGPSTASDVLLTDVLPPGVTVIAATATLGSCRLTDALTLTCGIGTMPPGSAAQIGVLATASSELPGVNPMVNTATVTSGGTFDPDPGNNSASEATLVVAPLQGPGDSDGDGLSNADEIRAGLNPLDPTGVNGAGGDPDGDGLTNLQELGARPQSHPRGFFRQYFAEGATGDFFQTEIGMLNASAAETAHVLTLLQPEVGDAARQLWLTLDPLHRRSLDVNELMGANLGVSTFIESDMPLAATRQMLWDRGHYGSTLESGASSASTHWYFAEGTTSVYQLFFMLQNPNRDATRVTLRFFRTTGSPVIHALEIPPLSRRTIFVNQIPGLEAAVMTTAVTADRPIVAERAMYLNRGTRVFDAGAAGRGVTDLATTWFFAEGATGYFSLFLMLGNPTDTPATATVQYRMNDGTTVTRSYDLPPGTRRTIDVPDVDPQLTATDVAIIVNSTAPIVAERVMWYGLALGDWYEGHASTGTTETGAVWAVGEASVGGPDHESSYVLVSNATADAGTLRVTLIYDDGATESREFALPGRSRLTLRLGDHYPAARDRRFSVLVESVGVAVPIAVDCARYQATHGRWGEAGGAAQATRIR